MDASHLPQHEMPGPDSTADQGGRGPVSQPATAGELLASALWHAAHGWGVFPCKPGSKQPATIHGFQDAVSDEERIRAWWRGRPLNVAVATGYPGPDVLDVDVRPDGNGWAAFNRLKAAGLLAGAFRLVRTRSGGAHVYFAGTDQRGGKLKAEHLDFKARGGYVLLPPSYIAVEHSGDGIAGGYALVDDRAPTGRTFDWAASKRLLRPPGPARVWIGRHGSGSVGHLPAWVAEQGTGNRNSGLFWAAMRAAEAGNEDVLLQLVEAAVGTGLDRAEALATVVSAAKKVERGG